MSTVVLTYVFTVLLQREGIVNSALQATHLTDEPLSLLYNNLAVGVAMVYSLLPFATLPLYSAYVNIDLDLVRASESLGASRFRAALAMALPLARHSMLASAAIVFAIALGFYIAPALLGQQTEPFLAARIADSVYNRGDVAGAAVGSTLLLAIGLAVVGAAVLAVGSERLKRALA